MIIAFDLDDTLVDWWAGISAAAAAVATGPAITRLMDEVRATAWVRVDGLVVNREHWQLLLNPAPYWRVALPGATEDEIAETITRFHAALHVPPFPEVDAALEALGRSHALAIISNNPAADHALRQAGLRHHFAEVVSLWDDQRKPAPFGFNELCERMSAGPADVVYVGDSPTHDVIGASSFGMGAVWLDRYDDPWTPPAGCPRITTLDQLIGVLSPG